MNGARTSGLSSPQRAHRALWILVTTMILMSGAVSAAVQAPPSPLVGFTFAAGSAVLVIALILAARVTIALERDRRHRRPPQPRVDAFPIVSRLIRLPK